MEDVDSIYIELVEIDNTVDILERGEFDEEALEEVIKFLVKTVCSSLKFLRRAHYRTTGIFGQYSYFPEYSGK